MLLNENSYHCVKWFFVYNRQAHSIFNVKGKDAHWPAGLNGNSMSLRYTHLSFIKQKL